ncbi:hypothetical protein [Actinoplanes sp. NPDC051411]|uniref:ATP-grasp domain-containing protein n=1 Tax=Actinoplanes sp. NPDC051411 TaxID=3155522 RepID=UPI00341B5D35
MTKIGLLTTDAAALAGRDHDTPVLAGALRGEGWSVEAPVWHDPAVDWSAFDLLVIRTPWDYSWRWPEFLTWLDGASARTRILNAPDLIRWNIDKRYLADFAEQGVPVIPTEFGDTAAGVAAAIERVGDRRLVVKPSVSAGSRHTGLFAPGDPGALRLGEEIVATGKTAMVQPAAESVVTGGENGLFFFNGRYSHAFHKGPILAPGGGYLGGAYHADITRADPSRAEIELGERVLEAAGRIATARGFAEDAATPLYARIDIAAGPGEPPRVIEVELFEPSLATRIVPEAVAAFTTAVKERLHM